MDYFGTEEKFKLTDLVRLKKEMKLDGRYNIQTSGVEILNNNASYYNYAPTPYSVLSELFEQYPFALSDIFVDVGCGLGRVLILAAASGCKNVIGVEINSVMYARLTKNIEASEYRSAIQIYQGKAEKLIGNEIIANKFFFFNPFDVSVLDEVINRIQKSCEGRKEFFFWAPYQEYVKYLEDKKEIFVEQIFRFEGYDPEIFSLYLSSMD